MLSRASAVCLVVSVLSMIAAMLLHPEDDWWRAAIIVSAVLAVFYGLIQAFKQMQGYDVQARRYRFMRATYQTADSTLEQVVAREPFTERDYEDGRQIVRELAKDALAEHADWVLLRREHPIEVIKG